MNNNNKNLKFNVAALFFSNYMTALRLLLP